MTTPEPADEGSDAVGPSGSYVQSLARGLEVIRVFDGEHPTLTLSDVAARARLSRATARRFLLTLVELGYVRTDGKRFALTARVLELGYNYLSSLSLPELAQPHLEVLSAEVHESTSASVLDGDDIVYVARVPVRRIMTVSINLGTRFPAFATSMGRAIVAHLPAARLDGYLDRVELTSLTSQTVATREQLAAELTRVRANGWAVVDQELEIGLRSLAVPIRDRAGAVMGAINLSAQAEGTVDAFVATTLPALQRAAADIERDVAATLSPGAAGPR